MKEKVIVKLIFFLNHVDKINSLENPSPDKPESKRPTKSRLNRNNSHKNTSDYSHILANMFKKYDLEIKKHYKNTVRK